MYILYSIIYSIYILYLYFGIRKFKDYASFTCYRLRTLKHDQFFQLRELQYIISTSHLSSLQDYSDKVKQNTTNNCKERQKNKFDSLLRKQNDNQLSKSNKWVVNLSSKRLSTPQKSLLSKGMKFAPAPEKIDAPTIIAEVESALNHRKVDQGTANNIRAKIVGVFNKPTHAHNNLTPLEIKALKELHRDPSITILPADKGPATIILDTRLG